MVRAKSCWVKIVGFLVVVPKDMMNLSSYLASVNLRYYYLGNRNNKTILILLDYGKIESGIVC